LLMPAGIMRVAAQLQWDDPNYSGTRVSFDKATFVQRVHEMFKADGKLVRVLTAAAAAAGTAAAALGVCVFGGCASHGTKHGPCVIEGGKRRRA
jgi:hypothetical protein